MPRIIPILLIGLLLLYAINIHEIFFVYHHQYTTTNDNNDINLKCIDLYNDNYHHDKNNIVFIKTHKTASSTVTRILWRHLCDIDRKRCFLPPLHNAGRIWNINNNNDKIIINNKAPYEVWLHHLYYSNEFLNVILQPTLLLSIVRRPSLRFQSAWVWYSHEKKLNINLEQYTNIITTSYTYLDCYFPFINNNPKCYKFKYRTGLDATSEELVGYPKTSKWFQNEFDNLIKKVYQRKIFLLVADRMDESLLVLGKLLGLQMTSLLYVSQKVLASKQVKANEDMLLDLDNIQPYDLKLYKAANSMLDCYIKDYYHHHEKFADDLYSFRVANGRVHRFCRKILSMPDNNGSSNNNNNNIMNYIIINSTIIKDKNFRYTEYCKRLYQDNDEAISQIWKWKNDTYHNMTDLTVGELKKLSHIDMTFLLNPKRAPQQH